MSWHQKVLRVDLNKMRVWSEPLNMDWARDYIGERGLASRYLWALCDPKVDSLARENVLIFATGPMTGTQASTSGRYAVVTKGALTDAIACSNSGGRFGAELKFCGYDLLVIEGKAETPYYLYIQDDKVELLPANDIWGKGVWYTEDWLRSAHSDEQIKIASIGQAGENLARFACVVNDKHRAAGRSGVGAVMGSKNLKAIAARGSVGVPRPKNKNADAILREKNQRLTASDGRKRLAENGTHAMLDSMQQFGGLPTNNFQLSQFDRADMVNVAATKVANENGHINFITNKACFGCTIACGRIAHVDPEHFSVKERAEYQVASGGLEYETAFAFGPVVGVSDIDALTFANHMMNEHGMDPISFGVTLAAAMELFEKGVITTQDTDGIDLTFGSARALVIMSEKTGIGEGFGKMLAMGSKRMCQHYGHPELAMHAKGQEFAGYDGRALQGMGLGYATSNRGACHLRHDTFEADFSDQSGNGKAEPCKNTQDSTAALDSLGICLFTRTEWQPEDEAQMLSAVTGVDYSLDTYLECGERIWNLEKLFNLEAGLTKKDDSLPPRMVNDPLPSGVAEGKVCELDKMLDEYYELRNWDNEGVPKSQLLKRLGLENLEKAGSIAS